MLLDRPQGELPLEGCPSWLLPNADAAGYYRWTLPFAELRKLIGPAYAKLGTRERVSVAHDVRAAMRAGTVTFADGMAALAPMAADADPQVAVVPIEILVSAHDDLLPDAGRARVEQAGRQLYGPVAKRLGWTVQPGESIPTRTFRTKVLGFLAFTAHDPAVIAEAARRGRAYAGLTDGIFHEDAVEPGLAGFALQVAVRQDGANLFDALLARLERLHDGTLRRRVLRALAATDDPALRERALALPLDRRLRKNERVEVLEAVADHFESRQAAWDALKREFDRLVPLVPESHAQKAISLAAEFCDPTHLADAQTFFGERAPRMPGGTRELAETLETVKLCVAYRDAQGGSAQRFFARAFNPPRR